LTIGFIDSLLLWTGLTFGSSGDHPQHASGESRYLYSDWVVSTRFPPLSPSLAGIT
jgi:hypothetical protein